MMLRSGLALLTALVLAAPVAGQDAAQSPGAIVAAAPEPDWVTIPPEDLLVMTLAPDRDDNSRQVIIQLMPPPFAQDWVDNIRTLARAHWYDGLAVMRVQDNYVVQWGDPNHDNPESSGPEKPLPEGLATTGAAGFGKRNAAVLTGDHRLLAYLDPSGKPSPMRYRESVVFRSDTPGDVDTYIEGFPMSGRESPHDTLLWPIHCYGMVGIGHGMPPDTGTGGELYAVIGQAPRHLDRNLALVGRVVEGIEHLSSLPRGEGAGGFYADPAQRTEIESVRVGSDLSPADRPHFEYLSTESDSFARYAEARANRRDPFFTVPAGGADICNIPVPTRRTGS